MRLKTSFVCVPAGEIYPREIPAGEECPQELESAARALGLLDDGGEKTPEGEASVAAAPSKNKSA